MGDLIQLHPRFSPEAVAKLESSGISVADAEAMGWYSVKNARDELHKSFAPCPALAIPYDPNDPDDYLRIRYLAAPPRSFNTKPVGKYSQLPGSGVRAFLPCLFDWNPVFEDVTESMIITEGEMKAVAACARGFTTIGLGGVYNFKTKDTNFLPELEACHWQGRRVYICYDSDAASNAHVQLAMNRLADELRERGAVVRIIELPHGPRRAKVGLDDYLLTHTDDEFNKLIAQAREPDPPEFFAMNEDVCYIENIDRYVAVNKPSAPPMTLTTFVSSSVYGRRTYPVPTFNGKGEASFKLAYVAPAWIKWPHAHTRDAIVYEPGRDRLIDEGLNRWHGWGCKSKKGDVKLFLELIDFLCADEPDVKEWLLDWFAYPIQHPGVKLAQAVLIHGVTQGVGKTLLGLLIGDIYGHNFYAISPAEVNSQFNGWAQYRQFIMADEICTGDKNEINNKLKDMITREMVTINIKGIPTYAIKDCVNYIFTSNNPDAIRLEISDRRWLVIAVHHDTPRERAFYDRVVAWRDSGDSASAIRYYLEHRKISPSFSPGMHAPQTRARKAMILDSSSDYYRWCYELRENADSRLIIGQLKHQRDLFTAAELLAIYRQSGGDAYQKITPNQMTVALKRAGFKLVYGGQPVRTNGKRDRYFAIRIRKTDWLNPSPKIKIEAWLRQNIELPPK